MAAFGECQELSVGANRPSTEDSRTTKGVLVELGDQVRRIETCAEALQNTLSLMGFTQLRESVEKNQPTEAPTPQELKWIIHDLEQRLIDAAVSLEVGTQILHEQLA